MIHSKMNSKIGKEIKQDVENLKEMTHSLKEELKEFRKELDDHSKQNKYDEEDISDNKPLTDKTKTVRKNTLMIN